MYKTNYNVQNVLQDLRGTTFYHKLRQQTSNLRFSRRRSYRLQSSGLILCSLTPVSGNQRFKESSAHLQDSMHSTLTLKIEVTVPPCRSQQYSGVTSSNFGPETMMRDVFLNTQSLQANVGTVPWSVPLYLPSTPFSYLYWLIVRMFQVTRL